MTVSDTADWPRESTELVSYGGVHRARAHILQPSSEDELAAIFKQATERGRRVTLRGAGLAFDDQSIGDDVIVSLEGFGGIRVDRGSGMVTMGAAATWGAVSQAALAADHWPAVVVSGSQTTAAGTLSSNSYSRFTSTLGKESHWVEKLKVVVPTGERLTCSRNENADLFRAIIGGQGCIAAVTEATYRLLPLHGARQVRTELRKTRSNLELIQGILDARNGHNGEEAQGTSSVLVPGTHRAFIFQSRYVKDQKHDPLPGLAADIWWRVPLEWAGRPAAVSRAFWELCYVRLFKENRAYVDTLPGYTFFMDANTRAKQIARRVGFSMRLTQQTHLIPADKPERAADFLAAIQSAMTRFKVSPVFYDVLYTPEDPDSILSSSHGKAGLLVSAAFEPLTEGALRRTEDCCRELAHVCAETGGRVHFSKNVHAATADLETMYAPQLDKFFEVKRKYDPQGVLTSRFFERLFPERMAKSRA